MKRYLVGFLLTVLIAGCYGMALAGSDPKDVPDGNDHPLLSRMPGFYISEYNNKEFDSVEMTTREGNISIEGESFRIRYELNEGARQPSQLQILRNYANAIQQLGGEISYQDGGNNETLKVTQNDEEYWIVVNAYSDQGYVLEIVKKGAMNQYVNVASADKSSESSVRDLQANKESNSRAMPKVKILQATKSSTSKANELMKSVPKAPAPLTKAQFDSAIAQVRSGASLPSTGSTGDQVVLTPDEAKSGDNYFWMLWGCILWDSSTNIMAAQALANATVNTESSSLGVLFDTVPGKTYLLDLWVNDPYTGAEPWKILDEFSHTVSQMFPQDGHILYGFIASDDDSSFWLIPTNGTQTFFKAILTPVY